ncbi:MAG TPA: extradiol dioxygenase [Thermoanaerobaculia bacterium]|nr:extradiol dioxygenase [Thermoanaerobaculia bacterium]
MWSGAHAVIYSKDADSDRAFLRDVLGLGGVDAGGGWLIFGLPPAEVAVHPAAENDQHELFLMCDDVERFVRDMKAKGVDCSPIQNPGWGILTQVALPGGGKLGVYQPRHARPKPMRVAAAKRKKAPAKKRAAAAKGRKSGAARKRRPARRKTSRR